LLPSRPGDVVLEIGVGTGVVALGLKKRGRTVIGIDISAPMLARALTRLGPSLMRADARQMPLATASVAHAVSVWVVHAVTPRNRLFAEAARVLRPGGRYLLCPTQRHGPDDPVQPILEEMFSRATHVHPTWKRDVVTAKDIAGWGGDAGFDSDIDSFASEPWTTSANEELAYIDARVWPALEGLPEDQYRRVTEPARRALSELPDGPIVRHAEVDVVVLSR
jgi:SAM-dependent methyltransferase